MNGFSDSITIGIVITLVFGALFFYLYSRQVQNEKRVSLIENILLDLKMAADANQSWGSANWGLAESNEEKTATEERSVMEPPVERVEAVSAPQPFVDDDVDADDKPEEESFKEIFGSLPLPQNSDDSPIKSFDIAMGKSSDSKQSAQVNVTKVQPNYAAMSTKELKSLAKQRGLNFPSGAGKREITDALRKQDNAGTPEPGSLLGSQEGASLVEEDTETL